MNRSLLLRLLALLAVFALVAASCGGSDEAATGDETEAENATDDTADDGATDDTVEDAEPAPSGEAGSGGEVLLLQWQAPSQANALLSTGTKDLLASSLVNEPLAWYGPDGSLVPALAAEIPTVDNGGVAEDFMSITWTLQDGVMWSDGTPLTADDVVFTWEYCTDEATGCSADFTQVESVTADDDSTVTVAFTDPLPYPYLHFVSYTQPIIQRAQFADCVGAAAAGCTDQNFAPVGTGPYTVTDLRPEDTVTYAMNPNYRGVAEGKPFFGTVTIKGGGDAESTARSVLEIGEADYAWNLQVAPEILEPMAAAGNAVLLSGFASSVEHINLNQTDPKADPPSEITTPHPILFNNPELARALSLAISRDDLVTVGYGAAGKPTCTIWPVGDQYSTNNDWCLTQNLEEANQILDDLGYVDTDGDGVRETDEGEPLDFTYSTSTNAVRQSNQELVKANWAEIGVNVEMTNEDASLFFDGTCASDACIWKFFNDMEMFTNSSSGPDPVNYLQSWKSDQIPSSATSWGGDNMPRMQSAEYDALWDTTSGLATTDPAYLDNVKQLQDFMIESGAVIPLIHRANVSAISSDITGIGDLNGWDSEYWNIGDWVRG
ncbi:MAG: peptide ABC transporter substrate-binding protein [Acidimicrobiia bacterium]|nr:peptide ABC transporter substrate-binding protein [Acidimicrobiia bacterium]MDH5519907.1 peptide ABC transporter substrate-binding protein [Acidimicrobiia bacterium]